MVDSQVTSITPATHADRHSVGGADPLVSPIITTAHQTNHTWGGSDELVIYDPDKYDAATVIDPTEQHTTNAGYTKILEMTLGTLVHDKLGVRFAGKDAAAGAAHFKVYRNGVAVGTECQSIITSWTTYDEVISGWSTGDLIQLYAKHNTGAGDGATAKDFTLYGTGAIVPEPTWS